MNILIIAHFFNTLTEKGNSRFDYLANMLTNNKVELITSSFSHTYKNQRNLKQEDLEKINYKLTTIYEPEYKKNVSLRRFYSHYIFSKNLEKYLFKLDYKPDVIYCAVPSLDVAKVAAKFAKKNNIRFIIDIQDLWPEAFKMVFNLPIISDLIFYPMKKIANYIYKNADDIVAVSKTYLKRAMEVNTHSKNNMDIFLGTDLECFDNYKEKNLVKFNDDFIRVVYIGTLGSSYNIKIIMDAISYLNNKKIKFIVIGDGPLKSDFELYAKEKNIDCDFLGRIDYEKMVGFLCSCDIAVNPISKGAAQSIINKVGDYAAASLPVLNTQENIEYRDLIEKYNIGFNCENNNVQDISEKLNILINEKELRNNMGKNNRKLAEEKFDRKKTYVNIKKLILNYDK